MRVLITRAQAQADTFAQVLAAHGAEPIFFPTIQITPVTDFGPLDWALKNLSAYNWLIFTSTNAVEIVRSRADRLNVSFPEGMQVAAVGPKTAQTLAKYNLPVHYIPEDFIAEAILPGLGNLHGKRVLLPQAELAHDPLPHAIELVGGTAHVVTVYHTLPADPDPNGIAALRAGVEVITFTSGSTARNFVTLVQHLGLNPFALPGSPQIACIGPKTAAAAREIGFQVDIVAEEHTVEGLVQTLWKQVDKIHKVHR